MKMRNRPSSEAIAWIFLALIFLILGAGLWFIVLPIWAESECQSSDYLWIGSTCLEAGELFEQGGMNAVRKWASE